MLYLFILTFINTFSFHRLFTILTLYQISQQVFPDADNFIVSCDNINDPSLENVDMSVPQVRMHTQAREPGIKLYVKLVPISGS